ncbi:transposase [Kitasatospora aburaviensis]
MARAAFPKGSLAMRMRDELGGFVADAHFGDLYPTCGRPALSPAALALVSVLQFAEGLSDRQAADAVRGRIDWKYALNLELTDPGFDYSVLSEFRDRLVAGQAEELIMEALLERCHLVGLLKSGGRQRTDSTHVRSAARELNRLELAAEAMRCTLNALAIAAPDWLSAHIDQDWIDRYGPGSRTTDTRRGSRPGSTSPHPSARTASPFSRRSSPPLNTTGCAGFRRSRLCASCGSSSTRSSTVPSGGGVRTTCRPARPG